MLAQVNVPHVYEKVAKLLLAITVLTIKKFKICCWNQLDQDKRAAFVEFLNKNFILLNKKGLKQI